MLRLLGDRLGRVRLLADAWYMRARLIQAAMSHGHCVIGRVPQGGTWHSIRSHRCSNQNAESRAENTALG